MGVSDGMISLLNILIFTSIGLIWFDVVEVTDLYHRAATFR
jgi:hypothetical protein